MFEWNSDNKASNSLWFAFCHQMDQLNTNFDDSSDLKMNDLTFYNPLLSSTELNATASIIAVQLDNIFINSNGAFYENNVNKIKAISDMVAVLVDSNKTVKELAAVIDNDYKFWHEV